MGIQKVWTSPYHAQTNGQVEWAHQMLMHMIGKLGRGQKVDWPKHLPTLVHAYNSTRLAITRYSPHYLMYRCWPCLPIEFYFPMIRGTKKHQHVDHYIAELCEWLWEAFKEAQVQSTSEAERQKWHYDREANVVSLEPGDLVLAKANAYRGGGKWRTGGRRNHTKWNARLQIASLPTSWRTSRQDAHEFSTKNNFSSSLLQRGLPCMIMCAKWARCTTTITEEETQKSETEKAPQSANCLLLVQCQTDETPLGWVNRRLCIHSDFFQDFLDKERAKSLMWWEGDVWQSRSALWQCRYWSHQLGLKDMTSCNYFNSTSLHFRDCKLTTRGVWNGCAGLLIKF